MKIPTAQSFLFLFCVLGSNCYVRQRRVEYDYFDKLLAEPKCPRALGEESSLPRNCGPTYIKTGGFMQSVEELLQHECDLVDPIRGREYKQVLADDQEVDFVVVGSGTGGSIVAGRLAVSPEQWDVALLEAGGPYPTGSMYPGSYFSYAKPNSGFNWNFPLEPQQYACRGQPNGQCNWPRGKVLGGTGVLHGMMYMRGNPYDYDQWVAAGATGWSYAENLPYYKKSERNLQVGPVYKSEYHGTTGPVTVSQFRNHPRIAEKILKAGGELGWSYGTDLNGKSQLGFTLAQATHVNGSRLSSYNAYIAPLVGQEPNLIVSPLSYVTKILFSDTAKKAIGVEYTKNNQTHRVYVRKEVIISAGSIQSPQILMLSGLGPKQHLRDMNIKVVQDMPQVGQNLQNHASYSVRFLVNEDHYEEMLNDNTVYQYLTKRQGPLTSTGLSQTTGFVRVNQMDGTPNTVPQIQMFFEGFLANCSQTGDVYGSCGNKRYITMTPTLLRPKSKGYIKLRSSNPEDPPVIQANYFDHPEDRQMMVDGIKFAVKLSKTSALKDAVTIEIPPTSNCTAPFGTDEYWHCAITFWGNPENHQVGTCRIGSNEQNSVVDPQLRVHGIDGLRVVDASVIPVEISGNVNAPIMMVAERGAEFIRKFWGPK